MKSWAEVSDTPAFKSLSAAEQANAREQYFLEVVAPRVPREDLAIARRQFDQQTYIRKQDLPEGVKPSGAGGGRGGQGGADPDRMPIADRLAPKRVAAGLADAVSRSKPIADGEMIPEAPIPGGGLAGAPAPVRAPGQILTQPAPLDQQAKSLTPPEILDGTVAPWKQEQMRQQRQYGDTTRSPEVRGLTPAQNLTADLRDATRNPVLRGAAAGFSEMGKVGAGALRAGAEAVGADGVARFAEQTSNTAEGVGRGATQDLRGNDKLIADVTSSIINSAPTIAMGMIGGPAMSSLFVQSALQDYAETGNAAHAGIQAAAEVIGERFGFGEQIRLLKGAIKGMPTGEVAKVFGAMIAKEIPGEQLTTLLQFMGDKFGPGARNPNATMADYLEQAGHTLAVTIGQTAVMGGGPATASTLRSEANRADAAVDRSAMTMAERAAADAGFTPVQRQKEITSRLDNFAAQHGMNPKAVAAIKKAAQETPVDQAPGFIKRAIQALSKRGLFNGPVDDGALAALDPPPTPEPTPSAVPPTPAAGGEAQTRPGAAVPATDLVDDEQDLSGLDTPSRGAADADPVGNAAVAGAAATDAAAVPGAGADPVSAAAQQEAEAGQAVPPAAAAIAGDPINRNWSAFTPESGSLGIPREQMPQIKAEHRGALVNFMRGRGITHESAEVDPSTLKPTQAEFSPKKVQGAAEFTGGDRSILVSQDGHILDGTHQWLAKLEAGQPVKVIRLDAPIQDLMRLAHQFPSSTTAAGPRRNGNVDQPDVAATPAVAAAPADGAGDQPGRGGGNVGRVAADGRAGPVDAGLPTTAAGRDEDPAAGQRGDAAKPAALKTGPRIIGSYGRTPNSATPIELRPNPDGTLTPFADGYAMADFESGEPITVPAGTSDDDAIAAIKAAGALSTKDKIYRPKGEAEPDAAAPATPAAGMSESQGDTKPPGAAAPTEPNAAAPANADSGESPSAPVATAPSAGQRYALDGATYTLTKISKNGKMLTLADEAGKKRVVQADSAAWGRAKLAAGDAPAEPSKSAEAPKAPDAPREPTIAEQAAKLRERQAEARRVSRETERSTFRDLLANPEIVGMSLKNVETLVSAKVGSAVTPEKAALLARAIHKEAAKRAAEMEKAKHRHPDVRAAALAEAVTSAFPEAADATPERHGALAAGFDHALKGKTKSTLAGDNLADMITGYEAAQRWIADTEEGAAWFEGRPVNKLQNTGMDLRRWYGQMRAQMKADEPDIKKAWKQIDRATARADLFSPLLPEGVAPGFRLYVEHVRSNIQPFKAWLEKNRAFDWLGAYAWRRSRYTTKSNLDYMLDGERYPGSLDNADAQKFQTDEAYRAQWLRDQANEYVRQVQDFLSVFENASSVADAAQQFSDRFVKDDPTGEARKLTSSEANEAGYKIIRSTLWSGDRAEFLQLRRNSDWTQHLVEQEATIALPNRAAPLTPPRLDRVTRDGPDRRRGNNVTPKDVEEMFGLGSVGFGKWVAAKQDQDHLNYAYDAFADLAQHFGAPINAIGFGRQMHFTIGALGHGKFAAHFSPNQPSPIGPVQVINVTNTRGDGTVYHEWIHALDHFLGGQWRDSVRDRVLYHLKNAVLTPERVEKTAERFLLKHSFWRGDKRQDPVDAALYAMTRGDVLNTTSAYKTNADALGKDYWGNDEELIARAAEAWAADTMKHTNTYLVNPAWVGDMRVTQTAGWRGTPYPSGDERAAINKVFTALAKSIKWTDGKPTVSRADFEANLPDELLAGEKRRKELLERSAMEALRDKIEARIADQKAAEAAEKADRARQEQEELDALAEQKLKDLAPPPAATVDAPPASSTAGTLSDDDLSSLFDEAAAELRESQQERPQAPPPGEPASKADQWTAADWAEIHKLLAKGTPVLLAEDGHGIPTIHEFGRTGKTDMLGFGVFRTVGDGWTANWDGGSAMRRTASGKAYTTVQFDGGTVPAGAYDLGAAADAALANRRAMEPKKAAPDPGQMSQLDRDMAASGRGPTAADPTAAALIRQAAALGVKGADEALTGLAKLFGTPGRLNSFPAGFDEDTYQKAKPHFKAALSSFQEAGKTLKDLFKMLIQQFGDGIKEYAIRFAKDEGLTNQLGAAPSASMQVAGKVRARLAMGHSFDWRILFAWADEAWGGTQAEGKYTPKDAYDAMEAGMNAYILSKPGIFSPAVGREDALRAVAALERVTNLLPTQTKRTAEQDQYQQFSTVPPFAYLANWVANIQAGETMAEFSAGIGGLAVFAKNAGARLVLNELSSRRAAVLREVFPGAQVFQENAEQIDNILPADIRPTVVVINPPFSSSASTGAKKTAVGAQHVEQALARLVDGGRFVGIVGEGMQLDKPTFAAWWKKIRAQYTVRAVVPVDGSGYAKYGTTFDNALLVIDKIPPRPDSPAPITTPVKEYTELVSLLAEVRNERPAHSEPIDRRDATQPEPDRASGEGAAAGGESDLGEGTRASADPGGSTGVGDGQPGGAAVGAGGRAGRGAGGGARPGRAGGRAGGRTRTGAGDDAGAGRTDAAGADGRSDTGGQSTGLSIDSATTERAGELTDSVFETYTPQRLKVPGAKPHPGALVQSAAMASVLPPAATYTPNLPRESVEQGLLSIAQIEAIVYAGQAHEQLLDMTVQLADKDPQTFARQNGLSVDAHYRRGFFIGDGTGVGKGREISGIILDNLRQGRKKAVWVSEKQGLMADAKRDLQGVGGDPSVIFNQNRTSAGDAIDAAEGVIFTTYSTLRSGAKDAEAGGFVKGAEVEVGRPYEDPVTAELVSINVKNRTVKVKVDGKAASHPFTHILSIDGDQQWVKAVEGKQSPQTRLEQLAKWLGPEFDGVIAFDEAHNAGNAVPMKGERGSSEPSAQALAVVDLQRRLPNARVVYVSATGATEVSNLSFATRLGLWGPGTAFPSVDNFIAQMTAGGLATMELVARDMKQTGAYLARSLSFDGVTYSRVEHELTPLQREIYDRLAEAWQVTLQNFMAALEATGVVSESGSSKNGRALSAAKSAYWGAQQRFFNQVITSMQMPSVIDAIESDLAAGDAVVLQLVNTNEAQQERAMAKRKEAGEEDLEDLDMTPRDQLIQMVEKSFPVQQFQDTFDDSGKRITVPVTDSDGKPVLNRQAVAMRDKLIQDLQEIRVPDGPLELILNHFGPEITAEVTGRKQRVVRKPDNDGNVKAQVEKRGNASARADADAFMADKKRILIFSDAGGTGFSFQADLTKPNQRKRKHYLIQPGWRANKAVQGLGRTHRTNQASAPHYTLASTDIPAHKRFLSSIARRLDQLGALTKGQRDTSSGGLFSEKDNLESKYATQAVRRLVDDVLRGGVPGIERGDFLSQLGIEDIVNPTTGQVAEDKYPPTRQFLNRMLSLTLGMQGNVFDAFIERMDEQVEQAAARGELDTGMQTLRALKTRVVQEQVVHTDERTGAQTSYVELELTHPTRMYPFPTEKKVEWFINAKSDKVWGRVPQGVTTKKDGSVVDRFKLLGAGGIQFRDATQFAASDYKSITEAEARERWAKETAARPATFTEPAHMIVGAMLPIWDRLNTGGILEVARTQTEDGRRILGRKVAAKDVPDLLKRLDIASAESKLPPAEILARILKGDTAELANGWRLQRARVSGDLRVELLGVRFASAPLQRELTAAGVIAERIQWNDRYFVPTDRAEVLAALLKNRPLVSLTKPGDEAPTDGMMSRAAPTGKGIPMPDAQAVAATIRSLLPSAPPIILHESVDKATDNVRDFVNAAGAAHDVEAVYHGGEIHVFPGNIASLERMMFVVGRHEIRHHGFAVMLGDKKGQMLLGIAMKNPKLNEAAKKLQGERSDATSRVTAIEEVLADMPVAEVEKLTGFDRLVARFRQWLRDLAAKFRKAGHPKLAAAIDPAEWTDRDVAAFVLKAEDISRRGGGMQTSQRGTMFSRVWHGTPYRGIEQFSTDRIGTGEGAQAYGWGLYFASKREIADHYRRTLAERTTIDGDPVDGMRLRGADDMMLSMFRNRKAAKLTDDVARQQTAAWAKTNRQIAEYRTPEQIDGFVGRLSTATGQLYEVEIPEDSEMLLWDKPLSEQPAGVRKILDGVLASKLDDSGKKLMEHYNRDPKGSKVYGLLSVSDDVGGERAASRVLLEAGIKGIKYLDGVSRNKTLKDLKREFLAELPEDAGFDEVLGMIGDGTFSPPNEAILKALADNDWLGFDYPAQAISAALGPNMSNFDPSKELIDAIAAAQSDATHNYVVFDGADAKIVAAMFSRAIREQGIPREAAQVSSYTSADALKAHPDYAAAKAGDPDAAARLVRDLVKPESIEAAKRIGPAVWVFPHALEASGHNMIPAMLAGYYASETGGEVGPLIVQSNRAFHTGADAMQRMIARPMFDGPVEAGRRYVLVDDVTTLGGTLAELADHIRAGGGEVVGVATLANASRAPTMSAPAKLASTIARRYGQAIRDVFQIDPAALTSAEAGYVIGFRDADELRARAAAAQRQRSDRLRAKGLSTEEAGGEVAPGGGEAFFSRAPKNPADAQTEPGWAMPEGSRFDDFVYKFQDKNVDLKRAIGAITAEREAIEDRWDAYLQEELFHGRAAKRTHDFVNNELKPLLRDMALKQLSTDEVEQYLHARHAQEANALIAERNPDNEDLQDGGSGMTNADAQAYLDGLEPVERRRLEAIATRVDAILAGTREMYVGYGLESRETVDSWAQMFEHYVPLMREDKGNGKGLGIGQGFSIKGRESKHRTGSTRKVVDILANIAMQRERAIVRGEKNRVAVALAGLVKNNPAPDLWQFDKVPTERVLNERTGEVETRQIPGFKNRPNVLVAKILDSSGKVQERAVVFNERNDRAMRMVTALKNLDAAQLEGVLGVSAKITRYFASINTQYNPVFGFVNLTRDVQGAALNLSSTPLAGHRAEILLHILPALRGVYREERAARKGETKDTDWSRLWEEFQDEGGATGFRDLFKTSADRGKDIQRTLDPTSWMQSPLGKVFTAGGTLKVPMTVAQKSAGWVFDWLSDYNQAMENSTRLAAYKVALEQGMSKQRAASLAKNLTVNFNRKGQAGMQAGALYAFFNASMQGTARIGEVLFDTKNGQGLRMTGAGAKIITGGILLGSLEALMLAAAGFDDDEPPEFVRERSLIIPIGLATGKKDYITIPMPLGWHVLPNIGRMATEYALSGFKDPGKRVAALTGVMVEAFNPIGNAGWSLQTISPTALDPLVALAENRDWTGKPIARMSFNKATPGFQNARDTASSPAKWIAEAINYLSGGTKHMAGAISPTPDQIDYLWGQVTGGVGRELGKLEQTVTAKYTGEDLPPYKVPLVGRFYGSADNASSQASRFYNNINALNLHEAQVKGLAKDGEQGELKRYMAEHPEAALVQMANGVEHQVQQLRRHKRELVAKDAPREVIKKVDDQMQKAMKTLNDAVRIKKDMATVD